MSSLKFGNDYLNLYYNSTKPSSNKTKNLILACISLIWGKRGGNLHLEDNFPYVFKDTCEDILHIYFSCYDKTTQQMFYSTIDFHFSIKANEQPSLKISCK